MKLTRRERDDLFCYTIPKHSVKRIISDLQLAEDNAHHLQMQSASRDAGKFPSEVEATNAFARGPVGADIETAMSCHCAPREADDAPFLNANTRVINRWTTLPMPTIQEWKDQSAVDPDISYMISKIKAKAIPQVTKLQNREYYRMWAKGHLEVEDDILCQWEHPKATKMRQLRRRVVPVGLRQVVYTAYHASPLAGHVGFYKTFWRIAARYYWPTMYKDIRQAEVECGHCILGNNVSHQAQQILGSLTTDEPFDIISIDIWIPGVTLSKGSYVPDKSNVRQAALTSLCNLTAFSTVGYLNSLEADQITTVLLSSIIMPNGLPKLVLLDDDSLFKRDLRMVLDDMGIPFHVVSPEQHEGILCERFHRYLNKVQRLMGLDTTDHSNWMMNTSFAAYSWNASPIDGTDVVRSFAAKARTFQFPLDVAEQVPRIIGNPGEHALQHVETIFPLWFKQKELLRLLTTERRERHQQWANKNRTRREFQPGDIVVIRRQIQSDAAAGRPAKQRIRARGPYRVLEKAGEDSYWLQRIPVLQELNRRPGVRQKHAAWKLERIPSSVVVHKRIDSMDTRWVQRHANLRNNPLEHNLGFFDFGRYHKAPDDANYAFDRAADLIGYEIDSDDDEDSEDENDDNDGVGDLQTNIQLLSDRDVQPSSSPASSQPDGVSGRRTSPRIKRTINTTCPTTVAQQRKNLVAAVKASTDKLFFIARQRPGRKLSTWHLVQVDEDETNWKKARHEGFYHVRFFIRCLADSRKKKVRECAYWPEIHEFKRDGITMGPIVPTKPSKVNHLLTNKPFRFMWHQDSINLFDQRVVGPFDFTNGYTVPKDKWDELIRQASSRDVYVGSVNRIVPLDKPDFKDRDDKGTPSNYLAVRWDFYTGNYYT